MATVVVPQRPLPNPLGFCAMHRCIYCLKEFEEAPKEHIIHAFLGARWQDSSLICKSCQGAFGRGIDTALEEGLRPFRVLLGTKGDHGGTGKPFEKLKVTSGETIDLGPGGEPKIVRPFVQIVEHDGNRHVRIRVGREQDIDWALHEVEKAIPGATFDHQRIKSIGTKSRERLDGEVAIPVCLGGLDFFRAVLKCCANLVAAHEPRARRVFFEAPFNAVRAFVEAGTGHMGDFARWLTSSEPLQLPKRRFADHVIMLTTRGASVEGVILFFGHFSFAVRLATVYAGPPIRCAYVVDPYREAVPAEQRLSGDELDSFEETLPRFDEQSPHNNVVVQAAWNSSLNRFMAHYTARINEETVQGAVDEVRKLNSRAAALPREQVVELVRRKFSERLERFRMTGDAEGITVVKTNTGGSTASQ